MPSGEYQLHQVDRETEHAVRHFIVLLAPTDDTAGAIAYGSRARGTHRADSDAEVAILLNENHQRFLTTTLARTDLDFDVLLEKGINISPLPIFLDEWEHPASYTNPALLQIITKEKIRL